MKSKTIDDLLRELLLWQNPHTSMKDKIAYTKSEIIELFINEIKKTEQIVLLTKDKLDYQMGWCEGRNKLRKRLYRYYEEKLGGGVR